MAATNLHALQVIGVRYRGTSLAEGDERSLDAFGASGVYDRAGVPVEIFEPRLEEKASGGDEAEGLGRLGGIIASTVASARRQGKGILLSGGDCTHCTGVVGGLQDCHGAAARIGLVWFDAHGDFNTPNTTLSGYLGGMPVAVCAGLAWPRWREGSHIGAPLPTDRILLVDLRNLDPAEEQLIRATGATIAAPAPGFPGEDLAQAVADLSRRCDMIYLHIDSDILDESLVPSHGTREPNGPDLDQVLAAIETVMTTGKVVAYAVVSVYGEGEGSEVTQDSGIKLIGGGLESWRRHGMPELA
ncbi:MAG: arginase family protein [Anaerolineae bacterium]